MLVEFMQKLFSVMLPFSEILFSFIVAFVMYLFFSQVLKKKYSRKSIYYCAVIFISIIIFLFSRVNLFSSPNMILAISLSAIFVFGFFEGEMKSKAFYLLIYGVITCFSEIMIYYIIVLIIGSQQAVNIGSMAASPERIIYKSIVLIISFIPLYLVAKKKNSEINIPFRYLRYLIIIFIFSLISLFFLLELNLRFDHETTPVALASVVVVSIFIMLSDFFMFVVFEMLSKHYEEKRTFLLIENQKVLTEKYILENEKNYVEIRKLWHDLSNHLGIIRTFLDDGEDKKASEYIDEVKSSFEKVPLTIRTGNEIADIVINQKRAIAIENGIKFDIEAFVSEKINIASTDLCVRISNSLDNAIEANLNATNIDKCFITMTIKSYKKFLIIEVKNYCENEPIIRNGIPVTSKSDKNRHGFGYLGMKNIVEKNKGTIECGFSGNIFSLQIVLDI